MVGGFGQPKSFHVFLQRPVHRDYLKGGSEVVEKLRGVAVIVSILSGPGDGARQEVLEAATQAGVKRFYPSTNGFTQLYRAPGKPGAYTRPLELQGELRHAHQASARCLAGEREYTFIGAGNIVDMKCNGTITEPCWCPWTQDRASYEVSVIGTGDAPMDWSYRKDLARYTVASLAKPGLSKNTQLNVPSDTLSQNDMVELFRKYAGAKGRTVAVRKLWMDDGHRFIANEAEAPAEIAANSGIPVDFIGRPPPLSVQEAFFKKERHWHLFPEVKKTTFEDYLKERSGELD
ncbi:uncharacterized protein C8Q71DRAFT_854189 [Rhodofomes roseus]|uniref:NmrA-like domain-containing protein n=1 Tax=Rhodofomes roseus TaxID=34475 RepID=A0ABQ8KSP0_9APHY|nr:uncharacterized protein C8Q71DRAFT_854189 [Rhodofomes roseus]KAH9841833.1 hypothetical protein C8Q71DRAFT_854189 [Rhodofomes roseus]